MYVEKLEMSEMQPRFTKRNLASEVYARHQSLETVKRNRPTSEDNDFSFIAENLLKKSSIYAISQVGNSKSVFRRILWITVLIAGFLGCSYEISRFLKLYFEYPIVINLQVDHKSNLEFPAVTVCSLNRMKKVHLKCLMSNISVEECLNWKSKGPLPSFVSMSERSSIASCATQLSGLLDSKQAESIKFLTKYSQSSADMRKAIGLHQEEFILYCTFNKRSCSLEDFSYYQNLRYGNCFTFNKRIGNVSRNTSLVGVNSGLTLVLDMKPYVYAAASHSEGARVVIHSPTEDPNPGEEGINISPGQETTLALRQKVTRRLPDPYKDHCVNYSFTESMPRRSQSDCVRACMQEWNYAQCSCIDPSLPHIKDMKLCQVDNITDACCLDEALRTMITQEVLCDCPLPCYSLSYKLNKFSAVWPSASIYFDSDDPDKYKYVRKSQAKLKVYYSSLELTMHEQKPMFQDSELFSNLGGQLGLWLGLSLVAVFELLENLIWLCKYCFSPKKEKN